jgi:hypothetical protein
MSILPFSVGVLLALRAYAETPPAAPPPCRVVTIPGTNAESIAARMDGIVTGVAAKALSPGSLLVCAAEPTITELARAIPQLSSAQLPKTESHSVRLFYNRNAAEVARVLDNVFPGIKVHSLGSDTLVFATSALDQEENIHELKRWIALIDSPRPEVTLNVWSVQLSSKNLPELSEDSDRVRGLVAYQNEQLHEALERAWNDLSQQIQGDDFYDEYFARYISLRAGRGPAQKFELESCGEDAYCLGFGGAFRPLRPALSHMLGVLAAAAGPKAADAAGRSLADRFVDCLEGRATCPSLGPKGNASREAGAEPARSALEGCEADDENHLRQNPGGAAFNCFRQQLKESLEPRRKALLRVALADFLFQYKFSVQYPHDFGSYDYAASSQALDSQFDPLLVAFNRDVAIFLKDLQERVGKREDKRKGISLSSNGIISVRTLSGIETTVDTTAQSNFQNIPPPLVQDFVKQLGKVEGETPAVLQGNLGAKGAEAVAAFLFDRLPWPCVQSAGNTGEPAGRGIGGTENLPGDEGRGRSANSDAGWRHPAGHDGPDLPADDGHEHPRRVTAPVRSLVVFGIAEQGTRPDSALAAVCRAALYREPDQPEALAFHGIPPQLRDRQRGGRTHGRRPVERTSVRKGRRGDRGASECRP